MAPKKHKSYGKWSNSTMEKAVDMYINGRSSGPSIASKMNVPVATLYDRANKRFLKQKDMSSRIKAQKKKDESINEDSNQFSSTSNLILDNSVTDLNYMQKKQTGTTNTTCFSTQTEGNQLPQKNQQDITNLGQEHTTIGNNTINEKNLVVEECDLFGKYVINQLKQFNNQTRTLVKHKFQTILFEAEMGRFTKCKEEPQEHYHV